MNPKISFLYLITMVTAMFLAAGCKTPVPDIGSYVTPYGLRADLIPANLLEAPGPAREVVWLNASRMQKQRNKEDYDYYLDVRYEARAETGLLDIQPGPSLVIVADGSEMKFSGIGSLNQRSEKGEFVNESAIYEVQASDIRKIAEAKKVVVRLIGRNGIVVREFGPENFQRFKKFAASFT
ncbi:MAG: hypothetical protein AB1813_02510 [Verrucomicrobiota bacterium]|jgi:hypothetical protein